MNEIQKQNDIFISTILNPQATVPQLLANGINASNTGLLSPDIYKNSKFVLQLFTDQNGNFNNEAFINAYNKANMQFNEMTSYKSYDDLKEKLAAYDQNDLFAPLNSNFQQPTYSISKVQNPYKVSSGVSSLLGEGARTKSDRELAQLHKVWDSENNKWLDYTPEDRGLFGSIFNLQLIYATYDEDGWYDDPSIGRKVFHKKGEMRTDENGEFYTETAGNKERYGKQFVSIGDILTKENSWLNKYDFFDSDGLTKSTTGTVFKFLAEITPYMIPYFNVYYGGITAAYNLLGVMPTFAKALEGIATGNNDSEFSKKMNMMENYFHGFDDSYSDEAMQSNWGLEKMATMVSDIFAQLYQMRAMSSISLLKNSELNAKQSKAFQKFTSEFGESYAVAAADPKSKLKPGLEGMVQWWNKNAEAMPEIKAILDSRSKLSKSLSLGYMALTSSADVYSDALQGGYDPRMAGIAALTATAGLYLLMMNNKMGDWFLDATTGYKENISKSTMKQIMREYYDEIAKATEQLGKAVSELEKMNILAKCFHGVYNKGIKGFFNLIKDGGEEFWKRSIIEGVEEVTEEAVMDMTKGVFDTLSWLGVGTNADRASFGGWQNVFSEQGLERYVQNFVGGFIGGSLFEFQGKVLEPAIKSLITGQATPETKTTLLREIISGHSRELKEALHELCSADNDINALVLELDGKKVEIAKFPDVTTRGQLIENQLSAWIDYCESIVVANKAKLTDSQLFSKMMRDEVLVPMIEESEVHKMILSDFYKSIADVVDIQTKVSNETAKQKGEEKSETLKTLEQELKEKQTVLQDYLEGKNSEKYLKTALLYLHPDLRRLVCNMDKYSYTQGKYGISYNDASIPDSGAGLSRQSIDKEYAEWKKETNPELQFIKYVVPAYDRILKKLSPEIKKYADTYASIRAKVLSDVLSGSNVDLEELSATSLWREIVEKITRNLSDVKQLGITLLDIIQIDDKFIDDLLQDLMPTMEPFLLEYANINNISLEDAKKLFVSELKDQITQIPVLNLDTRSLNNLIKNTSDQFAIPIFENLKKNNNNLIDRTLIDATLVRLGLSPNMNIVVNDENQLLDYFAMMMAPMANEGVGIDFESTVLQKYLSENSLLDNEMLLPIKRIILNEIATKKKLVKTNVENYKKTIIISQDDLTGEIEEDTAILTISSSDLDLLETKIRQGLNNNLPLEDIIEDYLLNEHDGIIIKARLKKSQYRLLEKTDPNAVENIKEIILLTLDSKMIDLYDSAVEKEIVKNPLYELLRNFAFELSQGDAIKIFDLLESESQLLSQLPSSDAYLRTGITLEQLENAIRLLDLFEAVVIGAEDVQEVDFKTLIAYNYQMREFHKKYGKDIKTEEGQYDTINLESIASLRADLLLLKNKLGLLVNLSKANLKSQVAEDLATEKAHEHLLLEHLLTKASELTLKGVSILPPKDEIDKIKDESEKLAFIEHYIYQQFLKINKSDRKEAITQLFDQLHISKDFILKSELKSYGLESKTNAISDYDIMVYWATILSTDAHEFLFKYNSLLDLTWFKHVPKYIQRTAAKIGYSFYADTEGIHDLFIEELFKDNPESTINKTTKIFFLNGITGAGKTSNVAKAICYMLDPTDEIFVCAPTLNQTDKFNTVLREGLDDRLIQMKIKQELFEYFLTPEALVELSKSIKDPDKKSNTSSIINEVELSSGLSKYKLEFNKKMLKKLTKESKVPKVIFIDEVTHFTSAELEILDEIAKKYNIKILTFGDTLQKGAQIGNYASHINAISYWGAPRLLLTTRSQNVHSKDNIEQMTEMLKKMEKIISEFGISTKAKQEISKLLKQETVLKYYETDDELHGHKIVSQLTKEEIQRIVKAAKKNNKKFGILAELEDGHLKDSKFENILKSLGLKEGDDYILYSPDPADKLHTVLGTEEEYFIIKDFMMPTKTDTNDYLQLAYITFYTYMTRHMQGTVALKPTGFNQLHIKPEVMSYTDKYVLPGSDNTSILTQTKESITKKLNGWTLKKSDTKVSSEPASKKSTVEKPKTEKTEIDTPTIVAEPDLTPLDKEDEEFVNQERYNWEQNPNEIDQTVESEEDKTTIALRGYESYMHLGLTSDRHCALHNTSLDFDGLLPTTQAVSMSAKVGMTKFKSLLASFPDIQSNGFKEGFRDKDILQLFYEINPNWAVDDEGKLPDNILDIQRNIYTYLIDQEVLKIDTKTYVFGKTYDEETDKESGFYNFDVNKTAGSKDEPLILYGYRIYTDKEDGTLNQYISTGSFPAHEFLSNYEQTVPNGLKIYKLIQTALSSNPNSLVVLSLGSTVKSFSRRKGLSILKTSNPKASFSLNRLLSAGLMIKSEQFGLITNDKTEDGRFKFLEFKAAYEANGDESIEQQKLEKFYKPVSEGGYIIEVIEDGQKIQKLACAGLYFVPISYTRATEDSFRNILILTPEELNTNDAIIANYHDRQKALISSASNIDKLAGLLLTRAKRFSVYGQTLLVLNIIDQVCNLTGEDFETVAEKYFKATQPVIDKLIKSAKLTGITELGETLEFIKEGKFNRENVEEFLKVTKFFGIMFIDANLFVNAEDSIFIKDRFGTKESDLFEDPVTFEDISLRMNFLVGTENNSNFLKYDFNYYPVKIEATDYAHIGLVGHWIQQPYDNLFNEILEDPIEYKKPLTRKDIDRSITKQKRKTEKEDLSSESIKIQAKEFDESSYDVTKELVAPDMITDDTISHGYWSKTKKKWIFGDMHIVNKFGWDITYHDSVQIYGNTKEYQVQKIYGRKTPKLYGQVLLIDESGETYNVPIDAITKVTKRLISSTNKEALLSNDYYHRFNWKKTALEKIGKSIKLKEEKRISDLKSRFLSVTVFNPDSDTFDYENSIYVIVPFNSDEDYLEVINKKSNLWIIVETAEDMQKVVDDLGDKNAGITILKLTKWKNKSKSTLKFDLSKPIDSEDTDSIYHILRNKYKSEGNLFSYISNVVLFDDTYTPEIPSNILNPEQKSSTKKTTAKEKTIKKPYMNKYTAEEISKLTREKLPIFKSIEDAKDNGFTSKKFFYLKQQDGMIKVIPTKTFYEKENLPLPDIQLHFKVGDNIWITSSISISDPNPIIKHGIITNVTDDTYEVTFEDTLKTLTYDIKSVELLFGAKYLDEGELNENPEENNNKDEDLKGKENEDIETQLTKDLSATFPSLTLLDITGSNRQIYIDVLNSLSESVKTWLNNVWTNAEFSSLDKVILALIVNKALKLNLLTNIIELIEFDESGIIEENSIEVLQSFLNLILTTFENKSNITEDNIKIILDGEEIDISYINEQKDCK